MKVFFLLSFLAVNVWAVEIPLDEFDQSKLETLLRNIPAALVNSSHENGFVRKSTRYSDTNSLFAITCEGDFYAGSSIPTYKKCKITVNNKADFHGDEYLIKVTNLTLVSEMYNAISYDPTIRKSYSHERVYGQAFEGDYKYVFRYMIICSKSSCEFRFSPKEAL
jgi:hypothetical protein